MTNGDYESESQTSLDLRRQCNFPTRHTEMSGDGVGLDFILVSPYYDVNQGRIILESLRVGVIGAGKMGLLHAAIFNTLNRSRFTAVSETDSMIRGALRQNLPDIRIFKDYQKMVESESLDAIVVTTPVFLHKPIIELSLERGLNVFVEKPMAMNGAECQDLLRRVKNSRTMVGYCRRYMGTYSFLKRIVDSEELGMAHYFQSQLSVGQVFGGAKGWQYDPNMSGGGVIIDLGCHVFDLLHYLFGQFSSVHGLAQKAFTNSVEDFASVNVALKTGLKGSVQLSWSFRTYRLPELKMIVHFDHGMATATEKYVAIFSDIDGEILRKGHSVFYKQQISKSVPFDIGGPEYTLEDLDFVESIVDGHETNCNFVEGARVNYVIDAIYSSIGDGESKPVDYHGD